ncbi:hypothetical protein CPB84DRAFT_1854299 [Gymnopilus junonius]|uniref:Uncharacterized protein n=1 Tax=Gymnopilus junonius TaxID=109634 RepID=A0A9P5TGP5_GYMJU|nr:hypothetical protein CPB84DRAFT_1854299 [Gymnopilus junonius]
MSSTSSAEATSTISSSFVPSTAASSTSPATFPTSFPPPSTPSPGGQSNNSSNNDGSIATSASLYLYTFLATLVLLLSVSAAIVIRSFILRRRHRLMVEEAIRNGTWVPPAPPTRPARVDLSKKPVLWEAYIDKKGDLVGHAVGGALGDSKINDVWKMDNTREWDMIKPFAATYLSASEATATPELPRGPPTTTGLATAPSVGSLRGAAALQPPIPSPGSQSQPDVEAGNGPTAATTPTSSNRARMPRPRAMLSRALNMLNPTPDPTSPLPAPLSGSLQNAGSNANLALGTAAEGGMTELKGPQVMRVAVFIAMPKPPSGSPTGSLSASTTMVPSDSHPLQPSASTSCHPSHSDDDDEQPLPHLEMGVADVLVVPHDVDTPSHPSGKKSAQRGSLGSMATETSDSDM